MARALGGEVARHRAARVRGAPRCTVAEPGVLLHDLPASDTVWMSHGDAVTRAPDGFRGHRPHRPIPVAAMEDPRRGLFARPVPSRGRPHRRTART